MTGSKAKRQTAMKAPPPARSGGVNRVQLVGRVAGAPTVAVLPSGDEVVSWRLVVDRPDAQQPPYVDTLECAAWRSRPRRSASAWNKGDLVCVDGALRRRFWRGPQGVRSRYEVEVATARRLERASSP